MEFLEQYMHRFQNVRVMGCFAFPKIYDMEGEMGSSTGIMKSFADVLFINVLKPKQMVSESPSPLKLNAKKVLSMLK